MLSLYEEIFIIGKAVEFIYQRIFGGE